MKEISYKTAVLAKEKGYRNPYCNSYYNDELTENTPWYDFPEDEDRYLSYPRYFAPKQAELQEWLREKGVNLWVSLFSFSSFGGWAYNVVMYEDGVLVADLEDKASGVSMTYEEALEEGLYKALILLK